MNHKSSCNCWWHFAKIELHSFLTCNDDMDWLRLLGLELPGLQRYFICTSVVALVFIFGKREVKRGWLIDCWLGFVGIREDEDEKTLSVVKVGEASDNKAVTPSDLCNFIVPDQSSIRRCQGDIWLLLLHWHCIKKREVKIKKLCISENSVWLGHTQLSFQTA